MNKEIIITTKHKRLKELVLIKEIRDDERIWFKVPETCSSVDIKLVINIIKKKIADFKESEQKNEKDIYEHFTNFIKDIEEYFGKVNNEVK